jgi:hypothetical protein
MNWTSLIPIAKVAGIAALGAVLGTGTTMGVHKAVTVPQIINIVPECPKCPKCPELPPLELVLPKR